MAVLCITKDAVTIRLSTDSRVEPLAMERVRGKVSWRTQSREKWSGDGLKSS
jgi:hypothetical protein